MSVPRIVVNETLEIKRIAVTAAGQDITVTIAEAAAGVSTVNGQSDVVVLTTDDITEGVDNLYYTQGRADARVAAGIAAIDFPVDSVNGQTGAVVLSSSNIAEGTNLYYTQARADARVAAGIAAIDYPVDSVNGKTNTVVLSTTDIGEGTNLYHTTARARSSLSGSTGISYNSTTGAIAVDSTIATKTYADSAAAAAAAAIVDSAPATLDTLNELAAALGDDPNFATTVTTALGNKLNTADFTSTADTWLGTKTTTNLAEGTNLYYTSARANSDFDTRLATKTTTDLAEGTNLYYTDARVTTRINNTSIDALSDVVITTGSAGQMIYYNGTAWVNSAIVDSPNINRFSRTNAGTGSNAVLAVSRNRGDAARAVDGGPWLGFEYVGTDNTQTTAPQNAIRSRYQTSGNHQLQLLQLAGDYNAITIMGQIQRGNHFLNTTGGVAAFLLTDTVARLGGNVTNITNSANTQTYATFGATFGSINQDTLTVKNNAGTTTYATFASTGTAISGAGLHTLTRTSAGTPGTTESRPCFNIQLTRTDQAAPNNNDGTSFRTRVAGSNGTFYTLSDLATQYATSGDVVWNLNLANGDQTGATFSSVNTLTSKVSSTTIRAGTASATPGGSSVSDIAVFSNAKILNKRPHRSDVTTHTMARGSTYTPAATVNNFIELTLTAGTDPTYIDVDNLTVAGEGGHQAILVYNNSGTSIGNGDLIIRNNGTQINDLQSTVADGSRIIFTVYCIGNYASCEYMNAA